MHVMRSRYERTWHQIPGPNVHSRLVVPICIVAAIACWTVPLAAGPLPTVVDLAVESGFQDSFFGHFKRSRMCVAADFDLDGRIDFFLGCPSDESFMIRNLGDTNGDGIVEFEAGEILLDGAWAYGGAAADYDNDGDYDMFVTGGGIGAQDWCYLFKNLLIETGELGFEEVAEAAGVNGMVPKGLTEPIQARYADCIWGDYNRDGNVDLLVSVYRKSTDPPEAGRNILWHNNGDGTFTDVTDAVGLGATHRPTVHSTFLDIDNDGDLDFYENNFEDANVLWRNQLVETGSATFVDVTAECAAPGEDLSMPITSFVAAPADINNDGLQDLIVFSRGGEETGPYEPGHAVFLNQGVNGFRNVAWEVGLNAPFQFDHGVMGCQVNDLNGDGIDDFFLGHGDMDVGEINALYVSDAAASPPGTLPTYVNISEVIDFPAPEDGQQSYPSYPHRTHGSTLVDVDGDGDLELTVSNGGPGTPEPNRLFRFDWGESHNFFKVRPVAGGVRVSRDAIGTRFALTISEAGGDPWTLYSTLFAGRAFSAQNGFEVYFGLAHADTIHSLMVTWPDGTVETLTEGLEVNSSMVIEYTAPPCEGDANGDGTVDPLDAGFILSRFGCPVGSGDPNCDTADQNGDGVVDPLDSGYVLARFGECP